MATRITMIDLKLKGRRCISNPRSASRNQSKARLSTPALPLYFFATWSWRRSIHYVFQKAVPIYKSLWKHAPETLDLCRGRSVYRTILIEHCSSGV